MTLPSVGVIVPTFDRDRELADALDSIAAQDYRGHVRTYVVFRPRRGISQLLDRFSDVVKIPHDEVLGRNDLAVRRNVAVNSSVEDLVAFLDDDDLWHPQKLRRQVEALMRHGGAVACATDFVRFPPDERPRWPEIDGPTRAVELTKLDIARGVDAFGGPSSVVVNGAIVRRLHFPENPTWTEDYALWLRLREHGAFITIPSALTGLRLTVQSLSRSNVDVHYARALATLLGYVGETGWDRATVLAFAEKSFTAAFYPRHRGNREAITTLRDSFPRRLRAVAVLIEAAWHSRHIVPALRRVREWVRR